MTKMYDIGPMVPPCLDLVTYQRSDCEGFELRAPDHLDEDIQRVQIRWDRRWNRAAKPGPVEE